MNCPCTSTPLRLFIRNLAQVDLATSTCSNQGHLARTTVRSYASLRAVRRQNAILSLTQTRQKSSNTSFVDFSPESIESLAAEVERSSLKSSTGQKDKSLNTPIKSQKGDDIAYSHARIRNSSRITGHDYKSKKVLAEGPVNPTFRKTRVENTGFALHYSAPRAPPNGDLGNKSSPRAYGRENSKPAFREKNTEGPESSYRTVYKEKLEFAEHGQTSQYPETWSLPRRPRREQDPVGKIDSDGNWKPPPKEPWQVAKAAMKAKFPEGWKPIKRLSPDALSGIRALHAHMPEVYTTAALANSFEVSPEAIRRILKSNWSPNTDEELDRARRWFERGKKIYTELADAGGKPPKRWRDEGIGDGKPQWLRDRNQRVKEEKAAVKQGLRPRPPPPALLAITTSPRERREAKKREEEDSGIL